MFCCLNALTYDFFLYRTYKVYMLYNIFPIVFFRNGTIVSRKRLYMEHDMRLFPETRPQFLFYIPRPFMGFPHRD